MKDELIELTQQACVAAVTECGKYFNCEECPEFKYAKDDKCRMAFIADHLIANGVTVQRWIPVSERLPESNGAYLVHAGRRYIDCVRFAKDLYAIDPYDFAIRKGKSGFYIYDSEYGFDVYEGVTHWMPLPEPPKEDE